MEMTNEMTGLFLGPKIAAEPAGELKTASFSKIKRFTERKRPTAKGRKSASSRRFLDFIGFLHTKREKMTDDSFSPFNI